MGLGVPLDFCGHQQVTIHRHKAISENDINRKILISAFGDVLKLERREHGKVFTSFHSKLFTIWISWFLTFCMIATPSHYVIISNPSQQIIEPLYSLTFWTVVPGDFNNINFYTNTPCENYRDDVTWCHYNSPQNTLQSSTSPLKWREPEMEFDIFHQP